MKSISIKALAPLTACALLLASALSAAASDQSHALYAEVLKAYVHDGRVDYGALSRKPEDLDLYLKTLAAVPRGEFKSWPTSDQLAFLLNLYNAATLRLIVSHYPIKSIKDIGHLWQSPWDLPVVHLFGKTITLNDVEHGIIRKDYAEPRVHMALVCASKGCPPLRDEPYVGARLNAQLDDQARAFLRNPDKFRIDRKAGVVYLSSIFKWYGQDFIPRYLPASGFGLGSAKERASLHFIGDYLSAADRDYLAKGRYRVDYLDYDWSLNERGSR
ncbi:MAG: DUF547 domain-containing protein [Elusimicrobia bacterium]|nr:DUF547 domain-containing protein [Elusimicrobiota bacterium]